MLWGNHSAFIFYIWTFNTNSCSAILCYRFNILLRSYSWNWFLNKIFLRSLDNTALIPALPRELQRREQANSRNSPFNLADLGHTMSGAFKRHFLVLTSSVLLVLEDGCNSLVDRWHHLNMVSRDSPTEQKSWRPCYWPALVIKTKMNSMIDWTSINWRTPFEMKYIYKLSSIIFVYRL